MTTAVRALRMALRAPCWRALCLLMPGCHAGGMPDFGTAGGPASGMDMSESAAAAVEPSLGLGNSTDILIAELELAQLPAITLVRVNKAQRYVDLLAGDAVVRRYAMRLGFAPAGHKTRQGDGKTPEGRYVIDWRNPNSRYYRSLHISYPNAEDRAQAAARGVNPGGDIMIHGLYNGWSRADGSTDHLIPGNDWTLGCIAVSNAAMDEMWVLAANGTPIEILP
ncbi:MAG: L,D-transpeptidase family protein [Xanthomonadaceae bacterium]|nr:L,D-transpeptidase family protein [Xanthomonadaceae bacterium]